MASEPFDASQFSDSKSPYVRAWVARVEERRGDVPEQDVEDDELPEALEVGR